MSGAFSTYLANALLNAVLRATSYTSPTTVYAALYVTSPTAADSGTEVTTSGTAYARQAVTCGAPSGGALSNSAQITFPVATADYNGTSSTVTHIGLRDASSAGNLLFWGALTTARQILTGFQLVIAATQLAITLT